MSRGECTIVAAALLAIAASSASAANWPQWRGPFFNGSTTAENLPVAWSETENVAWTASLPGASGATPIRWGDRLFLPSPDTQTGDLLALCLDARSGKTLWSQKTGRDKVLARNNMASPSAVTDGKTVWFYYGTTGLFAFDLDGKLLWSRELEKDHGHNALMFGYSSSPLLYKGKLYIVAIRSKRQNAYGQAPPSNKVMESYLLAVDPQTGKDLWRHDRLTDAVAEAQEAYSSAIPCELGGRSSVLVYGADYLTAHDPETGKELWRWGGYNPRKINHWRIIPSAVVGDELIYVVGPKYSTLFALRAPRVPRAGERSGGSGTLGDDAVAWRYEKLIPDASMPLYYKGKLFSLEDNRRILSCLDGKTGEKKWQGEFPGRGVIRASLTGADDKLYIISELREVTVLSAGDEFKILHQVKMAATGRGLTRSTIVATDGRLFIRTGENLYCIGR